MERLLRSVFDDHAIHARFDSLRPHPRSGAARLEQAFILLPQSLAAMRGDKGNRDRGESTEGSEPSSDRSPVNVHPAEVCDDQACHGDHRDRGPEPVHTNLPNMLGDLCSPLPYSHSGGRTASCVDRGAAQGAPQPVRTFGKSRRGVCGHTYQSTRRCLHRGPRALT